MEPVMRFSKFFLRIYQKIVLDMCVVTLTQSENENIYQLIGNAHHNELVHLIVL